MHLTKRQMYIVSYMNLNFVVWRRGISLDIFYIRTNISDIVIEFSKSPIYNNIKDFLLLKCVSLATKYNSLV